ncbi:hypothetical protein SASPL_138793 [Salvia splendens]|uniref:PGG domain-containing protein n=2 Tax=Salvia splendens TaxID=180675 RepID=A0A8X8WU60_SALSN|nr:hypothetical protein SASPL_138793 [Salvia splendens]
MGKTALQILNESPLTTINYLEMKMLITNVSDLSIFQLIPEMSNTVMVVVILIATMAFQTATNPAGGVWNVDDPRSSHKAGEAVMATTQPDQYTNLIFANTTAFICSITAIYIFTARMHINHLFFMTASWIATIAALVSIMFTYYTSVKMITPDEIMHSPRNKILECVMMELYGFGMLYMCVIFVSKLHQSWESKRRRQLDLAADAFPRRVFYWIFQQLEKRGGLPIV